MKIKLKLTLYFYLCILKKLILSRNNHCNKSSTQTFPKITYNTNYFGMRRAIKLLGLKFSLYLEGSHLFKLNFVSSFRENICPKSL